MKAMPLAGCQLIVHSMIASGVLAVAAIVDCVTRAGEPSPESHGAIVAVQHPNG
jgi:hypothetical protein